MGKDIKKALLFTMMSIAVTVGYSLSAEESSGLREITKEELTNYTFENKAEHKPPVIEDLTLGQQFILDSRRQEIKSLIAMKLVMPDLEDKPDILDILQRVVDEQLIPVSDVKNWQSLGIIFGDLLAEEMDMIWVSYTDELGESKALQWKKTMNFVFPITLFSKRNQFGTPVNMQQIYLKIKSQVAEFKVPENQFKPSVKIKDRSIM